MGGWCLEKNENTVLFEVHIQPVILTDACFWLILILGFKKSILVQSSLPFQIYKDFHFHGEEMIMRDSK